MSSRRLVAAALIGSLISLAAGTAATQSSRPPLSSPDVVAPPTWWRALQMPDGRTFVTDGGLSIDATLAKPTTMPAIVLPPESAKNLSGMLAAPYDRESNFADLSPGSFKNSFMTPDGVFLNGNYVNFLRQIVPAARTRLRTKGKTDPVVVVIGGQAVALIAPLQPPR